MHTNHTVVTCAKQLIFAHPLGLNLRLLEQWANHSTSVLCKAMKRSEYRYLQPALPFWFDCLLGEGFLWSAPSLCRVDKRISCTCWINNTFFGSLLCYIYHILYNTECYIHHNHIFWIKGAPINGYVGSVKQACAEIKRNCFSQPYFVIARNKTFLLHRFPDHWRNWTLSFIGFPRYWKYTGFF